MSAVSLAYASFKEQRDYTWNIIKLLYGVISKLTL